MTWHDLFDRAEQFGTSVGTVRETLSERRNE